MSAAAPVTAHPEWRLRFGGLVRSEWIKLRTLRSSVWCSVLILVVTLGIGTLVAASISVPAGLPVDLQRQTEVQAAVSSIAFAQLVAAVFGVLVISGEYGTGMIRSTFTAAPTRVPAVLAKLLVLVVAVVVVGAVSLAVTAAIDAPLLASHGTSPHLADPLVLGPLLGAAVELGLVAAFAFAIGTLVRNTAGSIAIVLGVLLVLPTVFGLLSLLIRATWVTTVAQYLPSSAGARLAAYTGGAAQAGQLTPLVGGLVLLAWVVVPGALALLVVRVRDV